MNTQQTLTRLGDELQTLEAETFEILDYAELDDTMAASSSTSSAPTSSTTSSTSSSG